MCKLSIGRARRIGGGGGARSWWTLASAFALLTGSSEGDV